MQVFVGEVPGAWKQFFSIFLGFVRKLGDEKIGKNNWVVQLDFIFNDKFYKVYLTNFVFALKKENSTVISFKILHIFETNSIQSDVNQEQTQRRLRVLLLSFNVLNHFGLWNTFLWMLISSH